MTQTFHSTAAEVLTLLAAGGFAREKMAPVRGDYADAAGRKAHVAYRYISQRGFRGWGYVLSVGT